MSERKDQGLLVIPFYSNPDLEQHAQAVDAFADFSGKAKEVTGLPLAIIDDGSELPVDRFTEIADRLITIPKNLGKSAALRSGLCELLADPDTPTDFIVQFDGDGDQSSDDILGLFERLVDVSKADPENRTLIIGDRYSERLIVPPNPESIAYRQSLLIFFGGIALQLTGAHEVRDWVSGARGMTSSMAHELVQRGGSGYYGLESEQLVIAGLVGAEVATAPLTVSRPRDPDTLRSKWMQNFEVYSIHRKALLAQGQVRLVQLVDTLMSNLEASTDEFTLDLEAVGEQTTMHFTRDDDRYTARVPEDYRATIFEDPNGFHLKDVK